MAWSPRELADLAGTSRRAVRHYDEIGLLPRPDRQENGYQLYGVEHLMRLLRIRRLRDLGVTLPEIASMGDADQPSDRLLRALDARLREDMAQLRQTRREVAAMLEHAGPSELPVQAAARVNDLPQADRALVVVLSRLLSPHTLEAYLDLMASYRNNAAVIAFDHLPDDADAASRTAVATGLAQNWRRFAAQHAHLIDLIDVDMARTTRIAKRQIVSQALPDLYGPAQLDVLARVTCLTGRPRSDAGRFDGGFTGGGGRNLKSAARVAYDAESRPI